MNIVETPCLICGTPIELGDTVLLRKVTDYEYRTLHFTCPKEREELRKLLYEIHQNQEELDNQLLGLRPKSKGQSLLPRIVDALHLGKK